MVMLLLFYYIKIKQENFILFTKQRKIFLLTLTLILTRKLHVTAKEKRL